MVNKKGYIKTLEAVIAIIIIVIISYTLIPRPVEAPPEVPPLIKGAQKIIGQSIQLNETIRAYLTAGNTPPVTEEMIRNIIDQYSPPGYDYTCLICKNPGTCLASYTPLDKSVYMTDILIASSEEQQNVKIVRIWFWKKPTPKEEQAKITAYNRCSQK